jgi:hypothetical protein
MKSATLLLPLMATLPLLFGACARQEPTAERDAEIERRVQQRLAEEHAAQEKQELAQRASTLAARERQLASREAFFATMMASLARDPASEPATQPSGPKDLIADEPAAEPSSDGLYAGQSGYVAPSSYTFESTQPSLDEPYPYVDPYLFDEPYNYTPSIPYVTIINQNTRVVYRRARNMRRGNMHQGPRMRPRQNSAGGAQVVPQPTGGMQVPTVAHRPRPRPVQSTIHRPTINRTHAAPRVASATTEPGRARPQPR